MKKLRENILFLMIAHAAFLSAPAIVHAENENYHPTNFTQPLSVSRGWVNPIGPGGLFLNEKETCDLVVKDMGWAPEGCASIDQILFLMTPDIDTLSISKPVTEGYVKLDDWNSSDISSEIAAITNNYKDGLAAQSERLQKKIEFVGWLAYPKVDQTRKILYYANILNWDGRKNINISVSAFDRHGYVPFSIVTTNSDIDEAGVKRVVEQVMSSYKPTLGNSYAEWAPNDKVASYGALGVFAGMLGVKYGKAASAGLFAAALIFLKKAWFLLLVPFIGLKKLFSRKPKPPVT
jgi:uncharacterized membrane-anchored protein